MNFSPDCFAEAGSLNHFIVARRAVAEVCTAGADEPSAAASVLTNVDAVPRAAQPSPAACARNCRRFGLFIVCSKKGISRLDGDGINCAYSLQRLSVQQTVGPAS